MQQLVIIVLDGHVAEGLLGVGYYSVGREEAPQDPNDRKNMGKMKLRRLEMRAARLGSAAAAAGFGGTRSCLGAGTGPGGFCKVSAARTVTPGSRLAMSPRGRQRPSIWGPREHPAGSSLDYRI